MLNYVRKQLVLRNQRTLSGVPCPRKLLEESFNNSLKTLFPKEDASVIKPAVSVCHEGADYQLNNALTLGKHLKKSPIAVAQQIVDHVKLSEAESAFKALNVSGPGFINIHLKDKWIAQMLSELSPNVQSAGDQTDIYGTSRVVVDYGSPNMAKQLHVGHLRSAVIGQSICHLLKRAGYKEVIGLSHVGDFGIPLAMVIAECLEMVRSQGDDSVIKQLNSDSGPDILSKMYVAAKKRGETDKNFKEKATEICKLMQLRSNSKVNQWYDIVCNTSRKNVQHIYGLLGIDSVEKGESAYASYIPSLISELTEAGVVSSPQKENGNYKEIAVECHSSALVIQKSDGSYLYGTTDLAALRHRLEELKCDRIIYITDAGQREHFDKLFEVGKRMKWAAGRNYMIEHIYFGSVKGEGGKKLRSRTGTDLLLEEMLNAAALKGLELAPKLHSSLEASILQNIGIGAVKYFELSQKRESDYIYSLEKALNLKGNTLIYILYAYSRVCGLVEKSSYGKQISPHISLNGNEDFDVLERHLALRLMQYSSTISDSIHSLHPHILCDYLFRLSSDFHHFYECCPVIGDKNEERRLAISNCVGNVIKDGLGLLNISTARI